MVQARYFVLDGELRGSNSPTQTTVGEHVLTLVPFGDWRLRQGWWTALIDKALVCCFRINDFFAGCVPPKLEALPLYTAARVGVNH